MLELCESENNMNLELKTFKAVIFYLECLHYEMNADVTDTNQVMPRGRYKL